MTGPTQTAKGPFKLVTVNTSTERATRLIARAIDALKDNYDIRHLANCTSINAVEATVREVQPNVLLCASMWTTEERDEILATARGFNPDIKTHALPEGFQVERGPDAVVDYLVENIPKILASASAEVPQ